MEKVITNENILDADKSPEQIEHEMERTRESINEKVNALESQVLGTIHTATDTVSETVEAVKDAVHSAPAAARDTIREVVEGVKDAIQSFSVSGCIRNHPSSALATSAFGGFLMGYLTGSGRTTSRSPAFEPHRPTPEPARSFAERSSGLFGDIYSRFQSQLGELAEGAISTGIAALKQSINQKLPGLIDTAVERVTESVAPHGDANANGSTRREYSARAPAWTTEK